MKNYCEQIGWRQKSGKDMSAYVRPVNPPIDQNLLKLELLEADEREGRTLHTHSCGDLSLLLSYKGVPAFISSFLISGDELLVEQLQGIRGKAAFRVATGVDCITMLADPRYRNRLTSILGYFSDAGTVGGKGHIGRNKGI